LKLADDEGVACGFPLLNPSSASAGLKRYEVKITICQIKSSKPFFGFGWIETTKGGVSQIKKNDLPDTAFCRFNSVGFYV
jgi:hypothetical protein